MSPKSKAAAKSKAAKADPKGDEKVTAAPNVPAAVVTPAVERPVEVFIIDTLTTYTGKPDPTIYNAEQDRIKKEIDHLTKNLVSMTMYRAENFFTTCYRTH
jgi:hypothetical protein